MIHTHNVGMEASHPSARLFQFTLVKWLMDNIIMCVWGGVRASITWPIYLGQQQRGIEDRVAPLIPPAMLSESSDPHPQLELSSPCIPYPSTSLWTDPRPGPEQGLPLRETKQSLCISGWLDQIRELQLLSVLILSLPPRILPLLLSTPLPAFSLFFFPSPLLPTPSQPPLCLLA